MFGTGNFYEKERREEDREEEKGGRSGPGHPARHPPRRPSLLRVKPFGHDATTDLPGELGPWAREEKFENEIMTSRPDIPLKLRATALE